MKKMTPVINAEVATKNLLMLEKAINDLAADVDFAFENPSSVDKVDLEIIGQRLAYIKLKFTYWKAFVITEKDLE